MGKKNPYSEYIDSEYIGLKTSKFKKANELQNRLRRSEIEGGENLQRRDYLCFKEKVVIVIEVT